MKMAFVKTLPGFASLFLATAKIVGNDQITGTISGHLVAPGGSGVGGIEVQLFDFYSHHDTNVTQADGGFTFTVSAGNWNFYVSPGQTPGFIPPTFTVSITETTNITNIQAPLLAADATITGNLKGPDGQPVSGIRVSAYTADNSAISYYLAPVVSDATGNFRIVAGKRTWFVDPECGDLLSK